MQTWDQPLGARPQVAALLRVKIFSHPLDKKPLPPGVIAPFGRHRVIANINDHFLLKRADWHFALDEFRQDRANGLLSGINMAPDRSSVIEPIQVRKYSL
jgi:hypothetical protein